MHIIDTKISGLFIVINPYHTKFFVNKKGAEDNFIKTLNSTQLS